MGKRKPMQRKRAAGARPSTLAQGEPAPAAKQVPRSGCHHRRQPWQGNADSASAMEAHCPDKTVEVVDSTSMRYAGWPRQSTMSPPTLGPPLQLPPRYVIKAGGPRPPAHHPPPRLLEGGAGEGQARR